jgi:hypothetical protein
MEMSVDEAAALVTEKKAYVPSSEAARERMNEIHARRVEENREGIMSAIRLGLSGRIGFGNLSVQVLPPREPARVLASA